MPLDSTTWDGPGVDRVPTTRARLERLAQFLTRTSSFDVTSWTTCAIGLAIRRDWFFRDEGLHLGPTRFGLGPCCGELTGCAALAAFFGISEQTVCRLFSMQSAAATPRLMAAEIRKVLAADAAMEWPGDSYTEAVCPRWSQSVEPVPRIAALATTFASIVALWAMLLAA